MVAGRIHRQAGTAKVLYMSLLALGALAIQCSNPAQGRAEDVATSRENAPLTREEEGPTVRLTFLNSSWPAVLKKVAEKTNSELVMDRVPPGRFTRRDTAKLTRAEAVHILNRELAPTGFRVIEQGRHLVALHLDSVRTRYRRPVLPTAATVPEQIEEGDASPVSLADYSEESPVQLPGRQYANSPKVIQVDATASAKRIGTPSSIDAATQLPQSIATPTRGASEVARILYAAFPGRAQLVESGLESLPSFRVVIGSSSTNNPDGMPIVFAIDNTDNRILFDAPPAMRPVLAGLIRQLDSYAAKPDEKISLVASHLDSATEIRSLAQTLRPMVGEQPNRFGNDLLAQARGEAPNEKPGDDKSEALDQAEVLQDQPLVQLEGLRGPVKIQDVPGIGMVVTGNQNDVDAVVRIIRELERVASGADANIHLLLLKHVNSEALAGLLNNVYEELTTIRTAGSGRQAQASIIPVVRPNAILIIAAQGELPAILELAEALDQPIDPRTEFEVFSLKSAVADDVVETLESLYGQQQQAQQQQLGLRVRMRAVADARTNSVVVQASPQDLVEIGLLIRKIDRDTSSSVSRMQVFPLKNAVADELADVINASLQSILNPTGTGTGQLGGQFGGGGGGQGSRQLQQAKSVVLELLTTDGNANKILRSGILADIRVTADTRVNSLIVTAPEQSMPLMSALIRQLDQPSNNVAEIKVFALKNSDAAAMAQLLETLFASADAQQQLGIQVAGAGDASSGLIPMRFSVDIRTNSLIAIGGGEALRVVEAILLRLDETDVRQRKSLVFKLKNSPAAEVATAINDFLQSQRDLAQIDPELVSNIELLEQEIIVVPEPVSNSLLISATPRYFEEILGIVQKLDEAPAQVTIQVLIVEVDLQNTDEFGVELGFQDSLLFKRGLLNLDTFQTITTSVSDPGTGIVTSTEQIVNQELLPGFLFNNQQLGNNNLATPHTIATQGLSNFSLGRVNGDLGFGGLVLSASSESVSALIRALAAQRNVQILSRPQIRTVDNQLAQIQVGQQVPVISGATTNNLGGITPVLGTPQQVGIILQVTPRITPDGVIVMETIANKSAISGQGIPIITDPTTGAVVESPIFDLTEARATVAVPDGQTIVLGGMITKSDDTLQRKVPWLGDIPVIGTAFRYDSTTTRRTELLIFMTPRIVRDAADSELIKQVEAERLHFLEQEAEEIHGPLFAVPPDQPASRYHDPQQAPEGGDVPTTIMPPMPSQSSSNTDGNLSSEAGARGVIQSSYETDSQPPKRRLPRIKWPARLKP